MDFLPLFSNYRKAQKTLKCATVEQKIVVIGPHQSGKSSIIECLLGQFFLPHDVSGSSGNPLIINVKYNEAELSNYWRFEKDSNIITDANEVAKEISKRLKNTKNEEFILPVTLEYHCQNMADLTFIELPESMDSAVLTEFGTSDLTSKKEAIIFLVLPMCVNWKFKYSNLCTTMEKCKSRTIVVLTYLDNIDCTIDLQKLFQVFISENFLYVTGTLCGSKFSKGKKKIEEIRKMERKFFRSRNVDHVDSHGINGLREFIRQHIRFHLEISIPQLLNVVNSSVSIIKKELTYKNDESLDYDKIILDEITRFVKAFVSLLDGTNREIETKCIVGGARISYIFREIFAGALDSLNPLEGLTRPHISATIRNICGTRPEVLFIPETCFEVLARKQIAQLKSPCYQCVDFVYEEMQKVKSDSCDCLDSSQFPRLSDVLVKITSKLIDKGYNLCIELVQELIDMESAYINTLDSNFQQNVDANKVAWFYTQNPPADPMPNDKLKEVTDPRLISFGGSNWLTNLLVPKLAEKVDTNCEYETPLSPSPSSVKLLRISSKEDADCQLLENLVHAYFSTVKRSLKDSIPKAIMLRMVNYIRDNLYHTLLEYLRQEKHQLQTFFTETVEERKEKITQLQKLCECRQILQQIHNEL